MISAVSFHICEIFEDPMDNLSFVCVVTSIMPEIPSYHNIGLGVIYVENSIGKVYSFSIYILGKV